MNSKPPAKKATAKKATAKKATAKKTGAEKASSASPAKKTSAKKAATTKATAKKAAPAKKASTKKVATTRAAPAKKTSAKKAATTKATAKKAAPTKKAPSTKPTTSKVESPFDAKFLESQKALLIEERRRLAHDAESLTAEANSLAELREPGDVQFDEESGEGDTLAVERERDLALSAQFLHQVEEIDHAMAKFDKGTYGICEVSNTPIPKERLKAIPWARERVEHKVGGFGRR